MKPNFIYALIFSTLLVGNCFAQNEGTNDAEQKRAAEWVATLKLADVAKAGRVTTVVATHLKTVRDWHNDHSLTNVPAGINPVNGKKLNELDRQVIADSALPNSVHENLMAGLRKDLNEEQVNALLDKYTVGKVAFTMRGYRGIVTNMTPDEEKVILIQLQQAREESVDYKNMKEISVIFKIHKTQIEQYLNEHGRNWKQLYKTYTDAIKVKKAAPNPSINSPDPAQ